MTGFTTPIAVNQDRNFSAHISIKSFFKQHYQHFAVFTPSAFEQEEIRAQILALGGSVAHHFDDLMVFNISKVKDKEAIGCHHAHTFTRLAKFPYHLKRP